MLRQIQFFYSCLLTCFYLQGNGEVYTWGGNETHQCGLGSSEKAIAVPTLVTGIHSRVQHFAIGAAHTLVITENNDVYGWGNNSEFQLALETPKEIPTPQIIPSLCSKDIVQISCGYSHTGCVSG
jgi:RCC1 and BTB domain-containing protein